MVMIAKPPDGEYAPYWGRYIKLVPEGDVCATLALQVSETLSFLRGLSPERLDYRYAPGKWSIRDIVGHLADTERIMTYRALRASRGDPQPLPGFDENAYVANANFSARPAPDLLREFEAVRRATVAFFGGLSEAMWLERCVANDTEISVRALAYVIAGHERHHVGVIKERYVKGSER